MQAEFYDELQELSLDLVNALINQDPIAEKSAYSEVYDLCHYYEGKENDHPFQWELLGDYSKDSKEAKSFYLKSLALAKEQNLKEYECTSAIALANLYHSEDDLFNAKKMFRVANEIARQSNNAQLQEDVKILSDILNN